VKTGKGGVPTKRAFRKEQRSIHDSYIGNISAHSTSEYADVGIVNHHTLGVNISNSYGSYGGKQGASSDYKYDSLNIDEALIPFVDQMDSSRLVIARTHAGQKIPIKDGEPALVESGAEYMVGQLASSKFARRSKKPGIVKEVKEGKYMIVEYDDGEQETIDIMNRYSSTKRASTIMISMENLERGERFDANQMLSWSKIFDGRKNTLANGKNLKMAIMGYDGYSFEDGYVMTEESS
jgi:DNA-directed RNA polymerase beta subunit